MILDQIKSTSKVSYVPFTNVFRRYKGLNITEKMIYMTLWSMAGEKSYCFPAVKTIAEELMIGDSTVRRALKSLEDKHCIYVLNQINKETDKQLNNLYYIIEFNPYEEKFNEDHYNVLERLYPNKVKYLTEEEIKAFTNRTYNKEKRKKPSSTNKDGLQNNFFNEIF